MAVVCASSDYEQLAAICDRVLVFGRGRIVRELVGAEVTKERITEQCYNSVTLAEAERVRRGRTKQRGDTTATAAAERRRRGAGAPARRGAKLRPGGPRSSATRCCSPGAIVVCLRAPAAGHVPDDGELHDDLRLAGDPPGPHARR